MGRWHADAVRHAGGRVVAVVDAAPDRASALARRLPGPPAICADLREALRDHRVTAVHVCTPVDSHDTLAREAMLAGAHVLMEKPLTPRAKATEALFQLAAAQGVLLCPVHQFLFQPGVLAAQQRLSALGAVRQLDLVACSAGADGATELQRETIALDILPHGLALTRRLLDRELVLSHWAVGDGPAGEIRVMARVGLASVMIAVSMGSRPPENSMTVRCMRGTVRAELFHGFASVHRGSTSRLGKVGRPFVQATGVLAAASMNLVGRAIRREPAYPGLRRLVHDFYLATAGRANVPISPAESIDVARVRDAIADARPSFAG
jgi:predicted dehydrogenase